MTDRAFSPQELAEYQQAASAAADRLLGRIDGEIPWALTHLFLNRDRPVVVVVARDDAAALLTAFIHRGGIKEVVAVQHEHPNPNKETN